MKVPSAAEARLPRLADVHAAAVSVETTQGQAVEAASIGNRGVGAEPARAVQGGRVLELRLPEQAEPLALRQRRFELDACESPLGVGFPVDDLAQRADRRELPVAIVDDRRRRVHQSAEPRQRRRDRLERGRS
ncbi:MAG: hypothetical protein R3E41_00145 [Burkholderiaceae bacterium]